ncbi:hypothetical protein RhiirA5_425561 [Rhizophagus irregularis]|uniref:Uncharacterized protein n=1 Tax=Rhizophagus irregularis TaxID=588596 RepID=A0A2I1F3L1_9GLOM|nr:hypothetical protein RhiirA5_425561 [Rhizophagus irregularis]PKC68118.1 hypothetical protein RhiirA1_457616 [Rhizophagus irregularis]PKY28961.1 hypothetical protein RhiirB3_445368 [Rhizophagus irregularis]CAB4485111.1 unnamed protein product [Rhizophagus irregularis]CAB5180646.1 unnamed protein product [Rhizophagus irregularis]
MKHFNKVKYIYNGTSDKIENDRQLKFHDKGNRLGSKREEELEEKLYIALNSVTKLCEKCKKLQNLYKIHVKESKKEILTLQRDLKRVNDDITRITEYMQDVIDECKQLRSDANSVSKLKMDIANLKGQLQSKISELDSSYMLSQGRWM